MTLKEFFKDELIVHRAKCEYPHFVGCDRPAELMVGFICTSCSTYLALPILEVKKLSEDPNNEGLISAMHTVEGRQRVAASLNSWR